MRTLACISALGFLSVAACGDNTSVNYYDAGSDGGITDANLPLDAAPDDWPITANDYEADLVSFTKSLTVPDVVELVPTCCRDFGAQSKDKIDNGTNNTDNAFAKVTDALDDNLDFVISFQNSIDEGIEFGQYVLLWDHRGLNRDDPEGRFVLAALYGEWEGGTSWIDARDGTGTYKALPLSFVGNTGEPRSYWSNANYTNTDQVQTPSGDLNLLLPMTGGTVALPLEDARLEGMVSEIASNGVAYESAELSGYVTTANFYGALNAVINSPRCNCVPLTGDLFTNNAGSWEQNCEGVGDLAACDAPEEVLCKTIAGNVADDGICTLWTLYGQNADINLDSDEGDFEALSFGFELTMSKGRIR